MDVKLTDQQRQIREQARDLAEDEFAEDAFSWEKEYPFEHWKTLAENDILAITLPERYGGSGATHMDGIMAIEGVAPVCPQTAMGISLANFGPIKAVEKFGTEQQKEEYIPPIANGEAIMAIAISEPDAGSDVLAMETSAEKDVDEYIINGSKTWITGGYYADSILTFVRFPDDYIGAIIVDTDTPGFDVQEPMPSMAGSPESFISINDARVPEENVVVKGRDGLRNLMSAYNLERMGGASLYWGTAKCAFDRALKYAQEREQFGKAIGENQAITHKLSQMAVNLETARLLIYKCVSKDELPTMLESSITKVHIGDIVNQVADEALQIRGARGYVGDPPEDWMYRYLRQTKITGGTREIHLNNIANALFEKGDLPDY